MTPAMPSGTAPQWLTTLADRAARMTVPSLLRPPASGAGRPSAVLMLFGESAGEPDLLIVQRSPYLRRHAGQPAFPGGAIEAGDDGPVAAALREASEEAGVDPAGVDVLAVLPELFIARSGFSVTPVLAWWRRPGPGGAAPRGGGTGAGPGRGGGPAPGQMDRARGGERTTMKPTLTGRRAVADRSPAYAGHRKVWPSACGRYRVVWRDEAYGVLLA